MTSRVALVAVIALFLFAHGVAWQKMHGMERSEHSGSGENTMQGD
jgi:hypothetical protein